MDAERVDFLSDRVLPSLTLVILRTGMAKDVAQADEMARAKGHTELDSGQMVLYDGFFRGVEVGIIGFMRPVFDQESGEHTITKPLAILVDDPVFDHLIINEENTPGGELSDNALVAITASWLECEWGDRSEYAVGARELLTQLGVLKD